MHLLRCTPGELLRAATVTEALPNTGVALTHRDLDIWVSVGDMVYARGTAADRLRPGNTANIKVLHIEQREQRIRGGFWWTRDRPDRGISIRYPRGSVVTGTGVHTSGALTEVSLPDGVVGWIVGQHPRGAAVTAWVSGHQDRALLLSAAPISPAPPPWRHPQSEALLTLLLHPDGAQRAQGRALVHCLPRAIRADVARVLADAGEPHEAVRCASDPAAVLAKMAHAAIGWTGPPAERDQRRAQLHQQVIGNRGSAARLELAVLNDCWEVAAQIGAYLLGPRTTGVLMAAFC